MKRRISFSVDSLLSQKTASVVHQNVRGHQNGGHEVKGQFTELPSPRSPPSGGHGDLLVKVRREENLGDSDRKGFHG